MHSEQKSKELNAWWVPNEENTKFLFNFKMHQHQFFIIFFLLLHLFLVVCYTHKYLFNHHTCERLNRRKIIKRKYELLVVKRQSKTAKHPSTSQNRTVHFLFLWVCFAIPFSIFIFVFFLLAATLLEFNQLWWK